MVGTLRFAHPTASFDPSMTLRDQGHHWFYGSNKPPIPFCQNELADLRTIRIVGYIRLNIMRAVSDVA